MPNDQDKFNRFLNKLSAEDPGHAVVLRSKSRCWVAKYAWFSVESPPDVAEASESVGDDHLLHLAVRNVSIGRYRVEFECTTEFGRIQLDAPPTEPFKASLFAQPKTLKQVSPKPLSTSCAIEITSASQPNEMVRVAARTRDVRTDDIRLEEDGELVVFVKEAH